MPNRTSCLFLVFLGLLFGCETERRAGNDSPDPLVRGLDISGVALYQSHKIPFMDQGEEVTDRPVPIIFGKDSVLRIFVTRQSEWQARTVSARVEVESETAEFDPLEMQAFVDADSVDEDLDTTINVDIPGEYITADSAFSVSLHEIEDEESDVDIDGNSGEATWPSDGKAFFGGEPAGGPLKLVLVPVRYNADDSGRLPDTSEEQLQIFKDKFYTTYPIDEVEISVAEPIDWDSALSPSGSGWDQLLNRIKTLRGELEADPKEYYYGLFQPDDSFSAFCGSSCVTGLAFMVTSAPAAGMRVGIGLGYTGVTSAETAIHEVGHLHGREHSPCGLGGQPPDPDFPDDEAHEEADIGIWGLDVFEMILKNPSDAKDFMSYCENLWGSDYTYSGIFERVKAVNALSTKDYDSPTGSRWRSVSIGLDGSLHPGPVVDRRDFCMDERMSLELLDSAGRVVGTVEGYFNPYGDRNGGLVIFPEPGKNAAYVRVLNRGSSAF